MNHSNFPTPVKAFSGQWLNGAIKEVVAFDAALTAAQVEELRKPRNRWPVSAMPNVVARYKLNEGTGRIAHDSTGNGHDGSLFGAANWISGDSHAEVGRRKSAIQFDGSHYAKVESPPKFTSGDFTISLWLNPVRSETTAYPFMRGLGYSDQRGDIGLMLFRNSDKLAFDANTGGNSCWLYGCRPGDDGGDRCVAPPVR